tara:strand:- start:1757 stop:2521 length:765 start_codon:yes stop_codon:yes gene_type:complete
MAISENTYRAAQGFTLPMGRNAALGTGSLVQTLQRTSLLGSLFLISDQEGTVDSILVGGQEIMITDMSAGWRCFQFNSSAPADRYIGVPLEQNQQVQVDYTLAAAGIFSGGLTTDPIAGDFAVVSVDQLGPVLSYCGGLTPIGGQAVAAGATVTVNTTIRRDCRIGRLVLYQVGANPGEVTVDNIQLNALNMQSGTSTAPIEMYDPNSFADDQNSMFIDAQVNSQLSITYSNAGAGASTVFGAFWVVPAIPRSA